MAEKRGSKSNSNSKNVKNSLANTKKKTKSLVKGKSGSKKRKAPKKNASKKQIITKRILQVLAVILVIIALYLTVVATSIWFSIPKVEASNFKVSDNASVMTTYDDKHEKILSSSHIDEITLRDEKTNELNVSQDYIDGLIDTEDANFYNHNGVDFFGMFKAVFQTIFTQADRGGSTLTMQLAKLIYMPDWELDDNMNGVEDEGDTDQSSKKNEEPIKYKLTQMAYALKIEQEFSKEEILENYMNTAYFGSGAGYGLKNASKYYFGVDPKDLSLSQAALLAGIPQSPNNYNPYIDIDMATKRRNVVLERMLAEEDITQEEYDQAVAENIADTLVNQEEKDTIDDSKYHSYYNLVYQQVADKLGIKISEVATSGLTIHTNLDPELQDKTDDIVSTNKYVTYTQDSSVGAITLDSQTGAVLSVGSTADENYGGTNYATNFNRQPGSTAKPIVDFAPAIEELGWSTHHEIQDKAINFPDEADGTKGAAVNNWDGEYYGPLTMQKALAQSRNTTAYRAFEEVYDKMGATKYKEFVEKFGFSDLDIFPAYSIGGWSTGTTPLEMAAAYAVFANGGIYNEPSAVRYVEISPSSPLYEEFGDRVDFMEAGTRIIDSSTAYLISKMLDPTLEDAVGVGDSAAAGLDDESLKTGTSNTEVNGEVVSKDKWVAGYTPDVTTVVWTGFDSTLEGVSESDNITFKNHDSYEVYKNLMWMLDNSSRENLHDDKLEKPSDVVGVKVKDDKWPAQESSSGKMHYFVKGTDDYNEIDHKSSSLSQPVINFKIDSDTVNLSWGKVSDAKKYAVTIDGESYKTITGTSIQIPFADFATTSTCKKEYSIGIQAVNGSKKSPTSPARVEFGSTNFCPSSTTASAQAAEAAEQKAAAEAAAKQKAEAEEAAAKQKAEAEEAAAKQKAEAEEAAAKQKAEEEAKQKAEEEAKQKAEEEVKQKAEEEAKQKAEEEAKQKAEEEAKQKAEEEAKQKAEEEAKQKAEEEAKQKAEEEAKQKAEEEAKQKAEEEAKQKAGE